MSTAASSTLDPPELDRYPGEPITPPRVREPIGNIDIRHRAHAMRYSDLLQSDRRYGELVAPQSNTKHLTHNQKSAIAATGTVEIRLPKRAAA